MKKYLLISALAVLAMPSFAQFSGQGNGTSNSPYLITNADELFEMKNDLSAYYRLENDVDMEDWINENNPQQGWSPIGNSENPFRGSFDGNNHVISNIRINRSSSNNVGLWGVLNGATINNVAIINASVKGNTNVGFIAGICDINGSSSVSGVSIYASNISGADYVGGIVGSILIEYNSSYEVAPSYWRGSSSTNTLSCNYCEATINGSANVGGICGAANGEYNTWLWTHDYSVNISNNRFQGRIVGNNNVGGIIGQLKDTDSQHYTSGGTYGGTWSNNGNNVTCDKNISGGTIISSQKGCGIVGYYMEDLMVSSQYGTSTNKSSVNNNVACIDTISGSSIYRIADANFTSNITLSTTIGIVNNKVTPFSDSNANGEGYGKGLLMKQSTYEGLGFDFNNNWTIITGQTLPYNKNMSVIPAITKFTSGGKGKIKGETPEDGTIYVVFKDNVYKTYSVDKSWEITLGAVAVGELIEVQFVKNGNLPSMSVTANATEPEIEEPETILGDSNSDGTVDAADVVGTINYILGKPSSSFNQQNADVNEDGQILVDDAVGTVNVIMNNQ